MLTAEYDGHPESTVDFEPTDRYHRRVHMSAPRTVEEMKGLLNLLPPEEKKLSASQSALVVPRRPDHMQTEAVNQFVDQMFERARCYRDTGKLPEQIKAEKD